MIKKEELYNKLKTFEENTLLLSLTITSMTAFVFFCLSKWGNQI